MTVQTKKYVAPRVYVKDLTPKKVLENALIYIDEYGWIKHTAGSKRMGFCAIGAIDEATTDLISSKSRFGNRVLDVLEKVNRLVASCLPKSAQGSIISYNDTHSRRKSDILQLFRCAIEKAEQ